VGFTVRDPSGKDRELCSIVGESVILEKHAQIAAGAHKHKPILDRFRSLRTCA
jgi:hypothetical protein